MGVRGGRGRQAGRARWWRETVRLGLARSGASTWPIVQLVIAVVAAYSVAHFGLGHAGPVTAVTVTLSSLGFVRDARPLRVLETAVGVTLGIALSEVILLGFGQGVWQLAVSVLVTLFAARFFSPAPGFAIVAGVQSALVAILPVAAGSPFTRTLDGLIGGAIALVVTALVPRNAGRDATRDARRVLRTFSSIVAALDDELRKGAASDIDRVLDRARATQPLMDQWRIALDSAVGIARFSPFLRSRLPELHWQKGLLAGVDLAVRDLRVVTRRLGVLMRDGRARPEFADLLSELVGAVNLLGQSIDDPTLRPLAQQNLVLVAVRLSPQALFPEASLVEGAVVLEIRPLVLDLIVASGLSTEKAQAALPSL